MNSRALMLPAVPLALAALGWWGAGSLTAMSVKPQPAPSVPQLSLPTGIETLAPAAPRPPLGYLELAAFGFTEQPKALAQARTVAKAPTASSLYVVDSILQGSNLNTATIGTKTVKVGDKLDKRYTVVAVRSDGVTVKGSGKRDKPELIGFRSYVAGSEAPPAPTANLAQAKPGPDASATGNANASSSGMPAVTPQGMRDFRQILETLKL